MARTQQRPRGGRSGYVASALPTDGPDILYSNWFKLESLPRCIRFSRFLPSSDIEGAFKHFQTPAHGFHRLVISFADAQTLASEAPGVGLEEAYEVDLADFLAGHQIEGVPQIFRQDARNILIGLLNKAWEKSVQDRGLLRREFVSGDSWFVPLGLFEKDRGTYTDDECETHWRQLAGRSETRGVHWHFGVSARATIAEPCYFTLRSHVVFTEDGQTPLEGGPCAPTKKELLQELVECAMAGHAPWIRSKRSGPSRSNGTSAQSGHHCVHAYNPHAIWGVGVGGRE